MDERISMYKEIFHKSEKLPQYGRDFVVQYENGGYQQLHYWAMTKEQLKEMFRGNENTDSIIRWCYIEDLDRVR